MDYNSTFQAELVKRDRINHDAYLFGFQSKSNIQLLPGEHYAFIANIKGEEVSKKYTPIKSEQNYFEVPIKIYKDGQMTPYLESLPMRSMLNMQKMMGKLKYATNGRFIINPRLNSSSTLFKALVMICGGTGITPSFSMIQHITNQKDPLEIYLIYANKTQEDILLKDQLDVITNKYPQFKYINILDQEPSYIGHKGYVTVDLMKQFFPKPSDDVLGTYCGPKAMNRRMADLYTEFGLKYFVKF